MDRSYLGQLKELVKTPKKNEPQILNELFIDIQELHGLEGNERDKKMLRLAMIAELDAVNLYERMANSTKNKDIKQVMLDVAKEEKIHAGEFQALLEQLDSEHSSALENGKDEIDDLLDKEK